MLVSVAAAVAISAHPASITGKASLEQSQHPTIEAEAETGAEVYRVRMNDGYGRGLPVVTFARRVGHSPALEVITPKGGRLNVVISADVWNRVRKRAEHADRSLVPVGEAESRTICLHPWMATVEMANTETVQNGRVPVRKASESSCVPGLTWSYGAELVELAWNSAMPCDVMDTPDMSAIMALGWCADFQGDRLAAASLFKQIHLTSQRAKLQLREPLAWKAFLGMNSLPVVDWLGEVVRAQPMVDAPFRLLAEKVGASSSFNIYPHVYAGASSREASVTGEIQTGTTTLAYSQKWVWDPGLSQWQIESWTVSEAANGN